MQNAGNAFMGIGYGSGENRAEEATYAAINSPLLDVSISGAKGVLFAISGGDDLTMHEVNTIAESITDSVDPEAKIIFGPIHDNKLKKGEIKVTVIATGFNNIKKETNSERVFNKVKSEEVFQELIERPQISEHVLEEISDDDWASVPAFLRRKK